MEWPAGSKPARPYRSAAGPLRRRNPELGNWLQAPLHQGDHGTGTPALFHDILPAAGETESVEPLPKASQTYIAEEFGRALGTFKGREAALGAIKAWLLDDEDRRSLLTGGPGPARQRCSASWHISLEGMTTGSANHLSQTLCFPPPNAIDVAIYVRNKVPADIVAELRGRGRSA